MRIPFASTFLRLWDSMRPRSKQIEPGPSDLGSCRRRVGYKLAGQEPDNDAGSIQAALGTAIHEKLAEIIRELNRDGWLVEHKVSFLGMEGTVDLYADKTVVDWKTTSENGLRSIRLHGPYLSHLWQITWYALALIKAGYEVTTVRINYIGRDSGQEVVYEGPVNLQYARESMEWLHQVKSTPLESLSRDYAPDSVFCKGCNYLNACWGGAVPDRDPRSVLYEDNGKELVDELIKVRTERKKLEGREKTLKGTLDATRPDDGSVVVFRDTYGNEVAIQWRGANNSLYVVPNPGVDKTQAGVPSWDEQPLPEAEDAS